MDIEKIVREITNEVLKEVQGGTAEKKGSCYDASYAKYMDHTVLNRIRYEAR